MDEVRAVQISGATGHYQVLIGSDLLPRIGTRVASLVRGRRCAIVADTNTARLYSQRIVRSLTSAGFEPTVITVLAGEASKSLERAGAVCDQFCEAGLDRSSVVIALGGGVVGDLTGFAAAIFHRGIAHVQVPTTLLAQVDSSIGGKTGVNTINGKNLLGVVHQPALVIADVDTLLTLPRRELNQGFAEVIKHAVIADASLFELLDEVAQVSDLHAKEDASWKLAPLIHRNVEIKAAIVARDEHDTTGERAILNFGHTVGHAIERAAGYGALLHGEAVSLGIVAACEVSVRRAGLSHEECEKVVAALQRFALPTQLPAGFPRDRIMSAVSADKKFERGQVRFVVTERLGSARLTSDVTLLDIAHAVETL